MSKRVKAILTTPEGVEYPGWIEDDGVTTRVGCKYADWARADPAWDAEADARAAAEGAKRAKAKDKDKADPAAKARAERAAAEAAARLEAFLAAMFSHVEYDPDELGEGGWKCARRLQVALDIFREALDGGDLRHAARAGVEFGKALEQMRVRLAATDVQIRRKAVANLAVKKDLNPTERNARDEGIRRDYEAYKEEYPYCDGYKAIGERRRLSPRQIRRIVKGK